MELDVRSYAQTERFAQAAVDAFGRLDIAVAAAGVLRRQPLEEMTDGAWDDMLSVDLGGVLRIFRSCAARMEHGGSDDRHLLDRRRRVRMGGAQPLRGGQGRRARPVSFPGRRAGTARDPRYATESCASSWRPSRRRSPGTT
ncbi:hypothetical protein Msi02_46050 [Microbispora siamensis]|uniref:SDR family oxidoreductase n=1 Tax=Microbispora siamensis TaxID=564413 RepID=A0ABQ4GQS1_9ACTN|nr:hypothetical protein Msi02_46050 [Microbispora siamensis]